MSANAAQVLLQVLAGLGGPALLYGLGRLVRDVWVAKINANRDVEVARLENGYRSVGGAHRIGAHGTLRARSERGIS